MKSYSKLCEQRDPNSKWIQLDGLEVPLLEVEVDGSWTKQGFTSDYGITVVVSCLTGDVLDYHVMSKYCNNCIKGIPHSNCNVNKFTI